MGGSRWVLGGARLSTTLAGVAARGAVVQAGHAGGLAFVVGVDRADQAEELRAMGADVVVTDLVQLLEETG